MTKNEVLKVIANGANPIVRTVMADGRYVATKTNDDYTVLKEKPEGWRPIQSVTDCKDGDSVVILTNCKDAKGGESRTIAVNQAYMNWKLKTNFSFEVKNGRTILSEKQFTDKEVKELVA